MELYQISYSAEEYYTISVEAESKDQAYEIAEGYAEQEGTEGFKHLGGTFDLTELRLMKPDDRRLPILKMNGDEYQIVKGGRNET